MPVQCVKDTHLFREKKTNRNHVRHLYEKCFHLTQHWSMRINFREFTVLNEIWELVKNLSMEKCCVWRCSSRWRWCSVLACGSLNSLVWHVGWCFAVLELVKWVWIISTTVYFHCIYCKNYDKSNWVLRDITWLWWIVHR